MFCLDRSALAYALLTHAPLLMFLVGAVVGFGACKLLGRCAP